VDFLEDVSVCLVTEMSVVRIGSKVKGKSMQTQNILAG